MTLGKNLKELRSKRMLTQYQVAEKLDISRGRYNSWENDIALPRYEFLNKLCDFYGVRMDELMGRHEETESITETEDWGIISQYGYLYEFGHKHLMNVEVRVVARNEKEAWQKLQQAMTIKKR